MVADEGCEAEVRLHLLYHMSYQAGRRRSYGLLPGFQSALQRTSQDGLQWNDASCAPSPSSPSSSSSSSPLSPSHLPHAHTQSGTESEWVRGPDEIPSASAAPDIEHSSKMTSKIKKESMGNSKSKIIRPVTLPPAGRGLHLKSRSSSCRGLKEKGVIDEGTFARVLLEPGRGGQKAHRRRGSAHTVESILPAPLSHDNTGPLQCVLMVPTTHHGDVPSHLIPSSHTPTDTALSKIQLSSAHTSVAPKGISSARRRTYGFLPALASSSTLPLCSSVSYCEAAMNMAPQYQSKSECVGVGDHGPLSMVTGQNKKFISIPMSRSMSLQAHIKIHASPQQNQLAYQ